MQLHFIIYILLVIWYSDALDERDVCQRSDIDISCKVPLKGTSYVFYDVNNPEGFNLRRDVYMRLAIFMHRLKEKWKLVLPPWPHLYHWRTKLTQQDQLPWSHFFHIPSLKQFAPVIEMHEFFKETDKVPLKIDNVFILQHYKDAFNSANWTWDDKFTFENCTKKSEYEKFEETFSGHFWGYNNISAKRVNCVSIQGGSSLLNDLLKHADGRYIMLDHAEIILHDHFGDKEYWQCRRSMKFAEPLVQEAKYFLRSELNVTVVENPPRRMEEKRNFKGGQFLCVHLRRRDFLAGRTNEVPSIKFAAEQLSNILLSQNLSTVFVATDATKEEIMELKEHLKNITLVYYTPDIDNLIMYKDGGIAIIEQIICSYSRYFIGSHESTFSFRIQEEREILGFPEETTFNRLCGKSKNCIQPSKWKIKY